MKPEKLLNQLDIQSGQIHGLHLDTKFPSEFILSIFKDGGAERWKIYGNKENYAIAIGTDNKHQVISASPIEEIDQHIVNLLSSSPPGEERNFEKYLTTYQKFFNSRKTFPEPEEPYVNSINLFLQGESQKTRSTSEIKELINNFRIKSGYEPSFEINEAEPDKVKNNIQSIRENCLAKIETNTNPKNKPTI